MRFITFDNKGIAVEKVELPREDKRRLNDNLLLFFTGITRKSSEILSEQKANINSRVDELSAMRKLACEAKDAILKGEFDAFGEILHKGWELKKQMASNVSNSTIDDIYETARRAGAIGGKVTGAGGGGFILFYCPKGKQDDVVRALKQLKELPFRFQQDGSKVVFNYRRG
jgi:D-glycero-alpha-D-manno-heptose-7-phosphate kinase